VSVIPPETMAVDLKDVVFRGARAGRISSVRASPRAAVRPGSRRPMRRLGAWSRPLPAVVLKVPERALTTASARVTEVGAVPSRRVLLHADHRYYEPGGLPLPSARSHQWLMPR
jgi:hypothetical protein